MNYPRELRIEARADDGHVVAVWRGGTAGPAVLAILKDRVRVPLTIDLPQATPANQLRLVLTAADPAFYWTVAEIRAFGPVPVSPSSRLR